MIKRFSNLNENANILANVRGWSKTEQDIINKIEDILDGELEIVDVPYGDGDVEIDSGSKEQVAIKIMGLIKDIVGEKYIRSINED